LDTAYHSFVGEVAALNTTTIRRLTPLRRHQLQAIARVRLLKCILIMHYVFVAKVFDVGKGVFRRGVASIDFVGIKLASTAASNKALHERNYG